MEAQTLEREPTPGGDAVRLGSLPPRRTLEALFASVAKPLPSERALRIIALATPCRHCSPSASSSAKSRK